MKKVFSSIMMIALVLVLALSTMACAGTITPGTSSKAKGNTVLGGVAGVDDSVIAALEKSGKVSKYVFGEPTDQDKAFFKEFQESYGGEVTPIVIPWEGWENKFVTDYASNTAPDVVSIFEKMWPKVANRGMIYTTDQLKNEKKVVGLDHPNLTKDINVVQNFYTYKGKQYGFSLDDVNAVYCFINENLFKEYEVKSPTEYYNEGTWNWENFMKCAKALTLDSNDDNQTDIYGYTAWDLSYITSANGGQLITLQDDGKLLNTMDSAAVKTGLENARRIYFTDKVAKQDTSPPAWYDGFVNGQAGILACPQFNFTQLCFRDNKINFDWSVIPYPLGPDNKTGIYPGSVSAFGVVSSTKNPQGAVNLIIAQKDYYTKTAKPKPGEFETVFNKDQQQLIKENNQKVMPPVYQGVGNLWSAQWDFWQAVKDGKSVTQLIEQYKPLFDAQIVVEEASGAAQ